MPPQGYDYLFTISENDVSKKMWRNLKPLIKKEHPLVRTLYSIRKSGWHVYVVSNAPKTHRDGIITWFRHLLLAAEQTRATRRAKTIVGEDKEEEGAE